MAVDEEDKVEKKRFSYVNHVYCEMVVKVPSLKSGGRGASFLAVWLWASCSPSLGLDVVLCDGGGDPALTLWTSKRCYWYKNLYCSVTFGCKRQKAYLK